ncbi:MAG TPA: MarR family winged helix-turn-helix transcriptional regulator, partial [Candidatus Saccharimonadales bacterium]|nr:MarR family winged helix-turn-helix transcriptional regulator [Candidatus Saccharimonadales bacterium]
MMGPTNNIGYLLQHLSGVLAKQSDQALQERLGIGFSQFKILRVLQHSPQTQQRQIAEWIGKTEASISRQIKLMI